MSVVKMSMDISHLLRDKQLLKLSMNYNDGSMKWVIRGVEGVEVV